MDMKLLPKELKPSFLEKVALAAKMYAFSFSLAIAVVVLPFTHFLPGSGYYLFLIRVVIIASVIFMVSSYLENIRKAYHIRAKKFIALCTSGNNNK